MNFTGNPLEQMMKQKPRGYRPEKTSKDQADSSCYGCSFGQGAVCIGICYRELTSGQVGPKCGGQKHE